MVVAHTILQTALARIRILDSGPGLVILRTNQHISRTMNFSFLRIM